jgi:hypothetical protein
MADNHRESLDFVVNPMKPHRKGGRRAAAVQFMACLWASPRGAILGGFPRELAAGAGRGVVNSPLNNGMKIIAINLRGAFTAPRQFLSSS